MGDSEAHTGGAFSCAEVHILSGPDDLLSRLRAERDENTCRRDFLPSEAVAMGRMLEEVEREEAKKRQAQAEGQPRGVKAAEVSSGNFPEETAGDSRDKVGAALGMSGKTYEKARAVVVAGRGLAGLFRNGRLAKSEQVATQIGVARRWRLFQSAKLPFGILLAYQPRSGWRGDGNRGRRLLYQFWYSKVATPIGVARRWKRSTVPLARLIHPVATPIGVGARWEHYPRIFRCEKTWESGNADLGGGEMDTSDSLVPTLVTSLL